MPNPLWGCWEVLPRTLSTRCQRELMWGGRCFRPMDRLRTGRVWLIRVSGKGGAEPWSIRPWPAAAPEGLVYLAATRAPPRRSNPGLSHAKSAAMGLGRGGEHRHPLECLLQHAPQDGLLERS